MTDKEKAKAYDEALKKASTAYKDEDKHLKATLERIFPELNESKDIKIRKEIISILRNAYWTSNRNRFNELVAWLEKQGKEEYGGLKSSKNEDVCKFMQYIEKLAKAYELNLPNRSYDIYAFAKDLLVWLERQGKQTKQAHFPKFTFDDVLALQCCMETVKKVQEDKELYEKLNLIHSKIYDAYRVEKQDEQASSQNNENIKELKKLIPNRFDPKTLKPFDKVLVRDTYSQDWTCGLFSHIYVFNNVCKYNVGEILYAMCIPYNNNTEHLVGTTEKAPEFYKYWED